MSDGRLLIQVIGLQRSGNHAIICWLESLFARPLHLNDLEHDYLADPARIGEIRALADRDCVILSFEDSGDRIAAGTPLLPHVARARSGDFPGDRLAFRYVLRDPYNCWASRAKAQDNPDGPGLTSSPRIEDFIADWKALAMLWRQDSDAFVCYNHWFRSAAYRRAACARLGGRYSEASLDVVSSVGGGSSFDGYVRPTYRDILQNARSYLSPDFIGRFVRDPGGYIRDPGELRRQRHHHHIRMGALEQSPEPGAERGLAAAEPRERRPGAMDQERAQVDVAALRDAAEPGLAAGGHLPRHQPEPGREIARAREVLRLADRRGQRGGVERADARDRRQPPRRRRGARHLDELAVERRDAGVELGPLAAHLVGELPHPRAQPRPFGAEQVCERESERPPSLRHRDATLEQDRPQLVDEARAPVHQPRSRPVQRLLVELRLRLQRHEPHGRPRRRLGDRLRVAVVVLLRLHIRLDVFRRHQPHLVTLRPEDPPQMMRSATGLHPHHARRQAAQELDELAPRQATAQHHRARGVQPREAAAVLAEVDPDRCNGHPLLPSLHAPPTLPDPSPEGRAIP